MRARGIGPRPRKTVRHAELAAERVFGRLMHIQTLYAWPARGRRSRAPSRQPRLPPPTQPAHGGQSIVLGKTPDYPESGLSRAGQVRGGRARDRHPDEGRRRRASVQGAGVRPARRLVAEAAEAAQHADQHVQRPVRRRPGGPRSPCCGAAKRGRFRLVRQSENQPLRGDLGQAGRVRYRLAAAAAREGGRLRRPDGGHVDAGVRGQPRRGRQRLAREPPEAALRHAVEQQAEAVRGVLQAQRRAARRRAP